MKKRDSAPDMLRLFKSFKKDVLDNKPAHDQMINEVRMMKFKVKPIQGDVSKLNFSNQAFVETIWQLGKMDDFIEKHISKIDKQQEHAFYHYFEGMYQQLQEKLSNLHFGTGMVDLNAKRNLVEMEIYKEGKRGKPLN